MAELFVPVSETLEPDVVRNDDVEVEWVDNDGAFGQAFSFGTVAADALKAIDAAPGALVLHWSVDLREGREQIVSAVERCAMRAHSPSASSNRSSAGTSRDGSSCFRRTASGRGTAARSCSGQTFAPDRDTPRRVVERWPDVAYPSDHPCHNPYGVWRLGPPGGKARPMGELLPVFMPSLRALLGALESKAGKPLTKKQVEAVRDKGVCVAMKPRDAQQLERERGYADFIPSSLGNSGSSYGRRRRERYAGVWMLRRFRSSSRICASNS